MARITLTDRFITSPKRVPPTGRADYADALVPGLALRVTATGHKSFVLIARYPTKPKNPTRRALGDYGELTLEQAREKAREWLALIRKGRDPKTEEAKQRAIEVRNQQSTFGVAVDAFLERYVAKRSSAAEVRRAFEVECLPKWRDRPVTDIAPEEVAATIRASVKRGAPYQAHNCCAYLRRFYNWAIASHEFGVAASPVERLRPAELIGKRESRDRTLNDDEIRAVWGACDGMGYPYGPLIRLLLLTGQREREVGDMVWSEVNLDAAEWIIPSARMKKGKAHLVPLAPEAVALLHALPRFSGPHVFTTTEGAKAVNGFSKAKVRLDRLSGVTGWRFHDLRRTMRTQLSALPIEDRVREAMIAHAQPALHRTYNLYDWRDEKRRGFELWEQRLSGILTPKPPAEVTDIEAERARRVGA